MSEFRFAEPVWAYAFYALAVFVGLLFWFERRGGGALDRFVSSALHERLVEVPSSWRRRLRIVLFSLSAVFLVFALMRPQWGMHFVTVQTFGAEIMICLDVSKSMLAEDVAPNRLERAKAEIVDLLTYLDGNQVGIIAFAGRASVLSPLTPDFGFLRLVLDGMGAHSVTRGGTRLEEPIRKALAGFGPPGEAARAILLITDGEDQDSFPLDAARSAAEVGVRILTIGFGDEKGSEIYVSNRRSGARELIRDASGEPVRSRLDGDLLREIALTTQGAYVPAGTGLLDLESIYARHIAPLTRAQLSERGRMVREEAYQWAVLVGLLFLVSCVAVSGGRIDAEGKGLGRTLWAIAILVPLLAAPLPGRAQPDGEAEGQGESFEAEATAPEGAASEAPPAPEDPREIYNRGIAAIGDHDLEEAEQRFRNSRRDAGGDGLLRFHAAYNLGWTLAGRAETLQESEPEQALRSLYEAADWFREAVRLRPDDAESRHNLEVVLNRALLLADALAKQGEGDLEARLEALAAGQRGATVAVATLLEQVAGEEGPHVAEPLRPEFRAAATVQRTLLSDADQLAKRVGAELEGIAAKPEEERTPEDQMRAAQLENLLHYMHRARERMGQARQQLRRRQAGRAYRRSAAALAELKRALDQLRDPVTVLDGVIESVSEVASYTGVLSALQGQLLSPEEQPTPPAWLTREYLVEAQESAAARTGELHARLRAGLAQGAPAGAEAARQLEAVGAAEPLVKQGHDALTRAARELEQDLQAALQAQIEGIGALREARERFLDLRGLLETLYADEKRVGAVLSAVEQGAREVLTEFLPSLRSAQQKNLDRAERLGALLTDEARALENASASPEADAEALESQRQRLETADTLLDLASGEMEDAFESLQGGKGRAGGVDFAAAAEHTGRAVYHVEALRRLFFSSVERIREIAERQLELADSTQNVAALSAGGAAAEKLGPLLPRQKTLSKRTEAIALELEEQSRQPDAEADPEVAEETTERLRLAAEHLLFAQGSMDGAATSLEADPPGFDAAREDQDAALVELAKALEQLVPPEQRQQGQDEAGEEQEQQADREGQRGEQGMDPAQLLQGVRDREAQRREEQERKGQTGYDTVEKDW
ncbi:MAG: VWA domain-containing protein [Deltaproteobacteria bacterium]|nr:VWA domain-containing protein [Deltaproteobacteria bacterium]